MTPTFFCIGRAIYRRHPLVGSMHVLTATTEAAAKVTCHRMNISWGVYA